MSSTLYRTLWRRGKASLDRVYRLSEMDPCRMDLEKVIQVYQVWFDIFGNFALPRSLEKYLNFQHLLYAKRMLKNQTIYAWKNMEYAYLHFAQNFRFFIIVKLVFFFSCKMCAIPFVFVRWMFHRNICGQGWLHYFQGWQRDKWGGSGHLGRCNNFLRHNTTPLLHRNIKTTNFKISSWSKWRCV